MMRALARGTMTVVASLGLASCGGNSNSGEVFTCPGTFDACGGDPTGEWEVSSMCIEGNLVQALNDLAPFPNCATGVQSAAVTFSGTVAYRAGTVTYALTTTTSAKLSYSPACMVTLAGTADAGGCALLASLLSGSAGQSGSCSWGGTSCDCDATATSTNMSSNGYTPGGGTITETDGSSYGFCVTGTTMAQRGEISAGNYGVMTLTKQ